MKTATISAAILAVAVILTGCSGSSAPHKTQTAAATSASAPPRPTAFLAGFRKSGLGSQDLAGATDASLLKVGRVVCEGFSHVLYTDQVAAFHDTQGHPSIRQVTTLISLAVRYLCPQYKNMIPATLINQPVPRVCHYHRFEVGVTAQPGTSWANRRYIVNVYNPHWVRVLHKSGHAPTTHWPFWQVKAWKLGRYHTTYKIWNNGTLDKNKYITRSHRCS